MALRILILGRVSAEVARALHGIENGCEVLAPAEAHGLLARIAAEQPDVVAVGPTEAAAPGSIPFLPFVHAEFARALRYGHSVSLITLALDHAASLESTYGAEAVEGYVVSLEDSLRRSVRQMDLIARTGRRELSAVLPETPAGGAGNVAQRARGIASRLLFKGSGAADRHALPIKATCSVGIAEAPGDGVTSSSELLARSRDALSRAQAAGGDRVVVFAPSSED